ncbi:MAG: hypothetical protein JJW00_09075, partial [Sulfurimonas sp.]|nr:hypothetical protein [Sulfurimonas sp.]
KGSKLEEVVVPDVCCGEYFTLCLEDGVEVEIPDLKNINMKMLESFKGRYTHDFIGFHSNSFEWLYKDLRGEVAYKDYILVRGSKIKEIEKVNVSDSFEGQYFRVILEDDIRVKIPELKDINMKVLESFKGRYVHEFRGFHSTIRI